MRRVPLPHSFAALLVAAAVLGASCVRADSEAVLPTTTTAPPTTTSTTAPTTTTEETEEATTTTAPPPPVDGLARGMEGPEVAAMQERLAALHYDIGPIDGVYGGGTHHAVMAFQKVEGLERTGQATTETLERLAAASPPAPLLPGGGAMRVEVDLPRQVVFLYKDDTLHSVFNSSTGNEKRYCVDGSCAVAVTPGGSFKVTRKIDGLRVSRLGKLYNPLYFNGGIAIHGSPSVPAYPASHGCVRIPMGPSKWFHDEVPRGTPVYVVGGKNAPVPFDEEAPAEDSNEESTETTTTTAPPEDTTTTAPPEDTTTTTAPPEQTTTTTTSTTTTTVPPGT